MGISECDDYLKANPDVERLVNGAPMIVSKVGTFGYKRRVPDGVRDLLKQTKKANPGNHIDVL